MEWVHTKHSEMGNAVAFNLILQMRKLSLKQDKDFVKVTWQNE